ncbi:NAD(P)-dependent dehydrogenase (short-subunit alcohol dehydrogenase family) [Sinorhizobium terangae]|uniref:Glucose 1-dehydrogenase n=1 Tax=Sinorhizobium terangae TaxID=110322 RepID=A0A6N7LMM9_SINTE|nr:glucose 1-dehydrogenase [Sinorhizobium terangae]MBB4189209.1 NAD(P)-dependent dehydrogenase (short-subunit alcohol dehydrogenase family) [Sinorhizobium terangae]MQX19133.1 glucose 1-dehydrogenase [Sinorhizobium terangae]
MLLKDRIAFITGAGQGIGAAIAHGLAAEGARIIATDINGEAAKRTADEIKSNGGEVWTWTLDVANAEACNVLAKDVAETVGQVSILINNAGVCPRNTIDSHDVRSTWDAALAVNLNGTLNVTLAFIGALRATKGTIINMASIASFVSTATSISYSSSKGAVKMLTQNLAQELAKDGVRVNCIAPGTFKTPMTTASRNDPQRAERFLSRIPLGRFGDPEELVGPIVFLASDMSSYVTGSTLVVDGGYLAV